MHRKLILRHATPYPYQAIRFAVRGTAAFGPRKGRGKTDSDGHGLKQTVPAVRQWPRHERAQCSSTASPQSRRVLDRALGRGQAKSPGHPRREPCEERSTPVDSASHCPGIVLGPDTLLSADNPRPHSLHGFIASSSNSHITTSRGHVLSAVVPSVAIHRPCPCMVVARTWTQIVQVQARPREWSARSR